jgi:L-alanine-DL-glutamate epimerase-like enolase superfamily enzyme
VKAVKEFMKMKIMEAETWLCKRDADYFDAKRTVGAPMPWDVVVLRLSTNTGLSSTVSCLAARSGTVTEAYLHDTILPLVLGRDPYDREAIWHEYWTVDRHLTFFPVYLPGPVDVALWELAALAADLPLYRYLGAFRTQLPTYASGLFHESAQDYLNEAEKYAALGIRAYKAHPGGPWQADMEIHQCLRDELGDEEILFSDPVAEYSLDEAIRVGRHLEKLNFRWLEEPFRDFELQKYKRLCDALDIPIAATETTRGAHWGVAQAIVSGGIDIVRADVSWKHGITGTLKIAHLAEAFGMNCEVHTTTMGLMDVANLHVSCAIRNCEFFEYFVPEENFRFPLRDPLPIDANGVIQVPEKPGLGVELDWDAVDRMCVSHRTARYQK